MNQLSSQAGGRPSSPAGDPKPPRNRTRIQANEIQRVVDGTGEQVRKDFEDFLTCYEDSETNSIIYVEQVKYLSKAGVSTVYVDFAHLEEYNDVLAVAISTQYYRMEPFLRKAIQNLVREHDPQYLNMSANGNEVEQEGNIREFSVSWYGLDAPQRLRQIRMEHHGRLVSISGTVTRTSQVRPELLYGTFECNDCNTLIRDVHQEFNYSPPSVCPQDACGNRVDFRLLPANSKFADWQKVRLQENANEVPSGAMPRSMDIIMRNECVEKAKAGDRVIITGTPIVVPDVAQLIGNKIVMQRDSSNRRAQEGFGQEGVSGLKALGVRELTYKMVFLASFVQQSEEKNALSALHDLDDEDPHVAWFAKLSDDEKDQISSMKEDRRIYQKLASSIAPHIYGHEDVKKGILLQLLGGVHKSTHEGINLRGDINVCVVGDPSTAKSQFLKYVAGFMPRAIYTSGKASSAAGLTASVMKDEETGEMTIEAGALMLADNGICCIDEFDKMDLKDQVAIHEAMEQQTISITKAGIQATLNARASILAAANPIHGRYDKKLSLKQNIAMSPPIMSRFDLFFVILDECHEQTDFCIAQHIINFHRFKEDGVEPEYSTDQLKLYLTFARGMKPQMTPEAREYLVTQYRNLRQADATGVGKSSYRITVRQLESMVRLSEGLAKLYGSDEVLVRHVTEAAYLLKTSIVHIEQEAVDLDEEEEENVLSASQVAEMDVDDSADSTPMDEDDAADEAAPAQKNTVTLSSEEYQRIVQSIILQIKRQEQTTKVAGMKRSLIIQWYMEALEDADLVTDEESLLRNKKIVKLVLQKLVKKEHALLEMRDTTLLGEESEATGDDPVLVINPSYYSGSE